MVRACSASAGAVTVFTYVLTSPRGPRGIRWLGAGLSFSAEGPRGRGAEGPSSFVAHAPRIVRPKGSFDSLFDIISSHWHSGERHTEKTKKPQVPAGQRKWRVSSLA